MRNVKGTVTFSTSGFFHESVSPKPLSIPLGPSNFFENSLRYSQFNVHHRCRWHHWQIEKTFNQKIFNYFIWTPLGRRVNIYINFCLQVHFKVSAAWYCSHCHQCQQHKRNWGQMLPLVSLIPVANLPPVLLIPAAILPPVSLTPVENFQFNSIQQTFYFVLTTGYIHF